MSLEPAIGRGLVFIARQQLADGGFTSYSSPRRADFSRSVAYRTTFVPSLILTALRDVPGAEVALIRRRVADFLLTQKSPQWTLNYWDRTSAMVADRPYPDDLDDTFLALAGLWHCEPELIGGGEVSAAIARLLIRQEIEPGGPYRTWLVSRNASSEWQDVDLAVNANVSYYLRLQNVTVPGVRARLHEAVRNENFCSPYYPNEWPVIYFVARSDIDRPTARQLCYCVMARQRGGHWRGYLATALAVSALLAMGYPATKLAAAVGYLRRAQSPDGSWRAAAFCIDPAHHGKRHFAGASALTTALCLEALMAYELARTPQSASIPQSVIRSDDDLYRRSQRDVRQAIRQIESEFLCRAVTAVFERVMKQDASRQIVLLPGLVAQAVGRPLEPKVGQSLAVVNVWGWMAYTTFDDFLDGPGDRRSLPAAVFALRQLIIRLSMVRPGDEQFQKEAGGILDRIDAANSWEMTQCRGAIQGDKINLQKLPDYGDYWQLADRSLGHAIAGLGAAYSLGLQHDSPTLTALRQFFHHYLIARQLNDEAHDWEEDLLAGHSNAAAVRILRDWQAGQRRSGRRPRTIDFATERQALQTVMWQKTIVTLGRQVEQHVAAARAALRVAGAFQEPEALGDLLVPIEQAMQQALRGRRESLAFIRAFQ